MKNLNKIQNCNQKFINYVIDANNKQTQNITIINSRFDFRVEMKKYCLDLIKMN